MTTLVKSLFYADPAPPQDAPYLENASSRSRAIDIYAFQSPPTGPRISYNAVTGGLNTVSRLQHAVEERLLNSPKLEPGQQVKPLDRIYYENNWHFARSFLCRRFVKDIPADYTDECFEDPDLRKFELFLNAAADRKDLSFISKGTSTSEGKLLASDDRLIYHFGFDWIGFNRDALSEGDEAMMSIKHAEGGRYIVRRTTAIAIVIRMTNTDQLTASPLCPKSWISNNRLDHRRTIILFNELYHSKDSIPFTSWISPDADGLTLWDLPGNPGPTNDTDVTALVFIQKFVAKIWQRVVDDLGLLIDECSKHIIYREQTQFYKQNVEELESIAERTWREMLKWQIIQQLIATQRESVRKTRTQLTQLIQDINDKKTVPREPLVPLIEEPFHQIIERLAAAEKTFADFRSRGQSISDLVYNIINVRQAQAAQRSADAAQSESRSLGRISWVTFIFFPLIAVAGIFGMNVDIFVNKPPSIAWFFIVSAPATVLVFIIAFLSNMFFKWRLDVRERKKRDELNSNKSA